MGRGERCRGAPSVTKNPAMATTNAGARMSFNTFSTFAFVSGVSFVFANTPTAQQSINAIIVPTICGIGSLSFALSAPSRQSHPARSRRPCRRQSIAV